jgi:hypothetical protein
MTTLTLTAIDLHPGMTVGIGYGLNEDGHEVMFGIDHRPAEDLIDLIEQGEEDITVQVEPWQVLGVVKR